MGQQYVVDVYVSTTTSHLIYSLRIGSGFYSPQKLFAYETKRSGCWLANNSIRRKLLPYTGERSGRWLDRAACAHRGQAEPRDVNKWTKEGPKVWKWGKLVNKYCEKNLGVRGSPYCYTISVVFATCLIQKFWRFPLSGGHHAIELPGPGVPCYDMMSGRRDVETQKSLLPS